MARRRSRGKKGVRRRSKGRGRRTPPTVPKRRVQRSKKRTIIITKKLGRGPEETTVYEEFYEEEW